MLQFVKWEEGSREQRIGRNWDDGRFIMASDAGNSKRQKYVQKWGQKVMYQGASKSDV